MLMSLYMSSKSLFLRNMSSDLKDHGLSKGEKNMFSSAGGSGFVLVDCHREVHREGAQESLYFVGSSM